MESGLAEGLCRLLRARSPARHRRHLGHRWRLHDQVCCAGRPQQASLGAGPKLTTSECLWVYGRRRADNSEQATASGTVEHRRSAQHNQHPLAQPRATSSPRAQQRSAPQARPLSVGGTYEGNVVRCRPSSAPALRNHGKGSAPCHGGTHHGSNTAHQRQQRSRSFSGLIIDNPLSCQTTADSEHSAVHGSHSRRPRSRPSSAPSGERRPQSGKVDAKQAGIQRSVLSGRSSIGHGQCRAGCLCHKSFGATVTSSALTANQAPKETTNVSIDLFEAVAKDTSEALKRDATDTPCVDESASIIEGNRSPKGATTSRESPRKPSARRRAQPKHVTYVTYCIGRRGSPLQGAQPAIICADWNELSAPRQNNDDKLFSVAFAKSSKPQHPGSPRSDDNPVTLASKHRLPVTEVKRKREEFQGFDLTGKGLLRVQEFENMVRKACGLQDGDTIPSHLRFSPTLDKNQKDSEHINFEEYLLWSMRTSFAEERLVPDPEERHVREIARTYGFPLLDVERVKGVFDEADSGRMGIVYEKEFERILMKLMNAKGMSDVPGMLFQRYWMEVDGDHDGAVNFEDFAIWYFTKLNTSRH